MRGGLNDYHCHQKHVGGFPFRFHTVLEGMVASSGGRWLLPIVQLGVIDQLTRGRSHLPVQNKFLVRQGLEGFLK